jgi:hypothetical protein
MVCDVWGNEAVLRAFVDNPDLAAVLRCIGEGDAVSPRGTG